MSRSRLCVPAELRELLLEFTVSCLLEQPADVTAYAADFFCRLRDARRAPPAPAPAASRVAHTPDDSIISDEDEPPVARFNSRRKSVFAETYDPEEDEEDGDAASAVHPKSDEQRARLADAVRSILLFRALDTQQMRDVLDAMFEKRVEPDDYIIKQGDDGDNFYVIESGKYNVFVKGDSGEERKVHAYDGAGSFGELALMYNMPRAATVQAITPGALWAMDRQTFRRILLKSAFKKRKMYEQLLDQVPMLKALQPYERANLADALVPRQFSDGELIIKQGDSADGMYFVEDGTVRISLNRDDGKEMEINRIGKGGYFGELALVTHRPRAASAYSDGTSKIAFLDVETFERLLGPCMEIMKRNIDDYEDQLIKIFGSKSNVEDVR
ncbi:cAMP-dependent protein kinase type II regulatory subunit isoform X1 [Arctopsyche grandis]|uniref:cAMP-dependent protein kinase type II regulatory subunit isoform X1 n=1 Tax=Arctopsyche grandis TaxID=121162 RepID=UPI00406D7C5C